MRILVQRVKQANVVVEGQRVADITKGLVLFVGIGKDDTVSEMEYLCKKISNLRIFEDEQGKMNLDIRQVKGKVLSVSQFTLYANTKKGNRPGFDQSAGPEMARERWKEFNNLLRRNGLEVAEGIFGAHMEVELVNDGPVTIWLDSKDPC
ncbi:MAG: D-tyrosyl-tRNA(Tyr) deacylase [Nitrospirae bacterium]|nr:D-tyrosyl-tRNA(Tyr) deacylase [Nitrospirota bacterium]